MALALGLYATHTMVPPTPGPIAAAGILNADLGLVILYGLLVSAVALLVSWLYAITWASRVYIDPEPDLSLEDVEAKLQEAPSPGKAFLPILIPIVLILLHSIAAFPTHPFGTGAFQQTLQFIGSPVVALLIGVLLAFLLPRQFDRAMLSHGGWVGEGLLQAASIILITGAGGAFGKVLQNSGITTTLADNLVHFHLGIWLPFVIAAAIKTAQGSSTVAIITTASIVSSMLATLGVENASQLALTVVMIGAGSMVVSHANDSYFWVVTQFSRMSITQGYKYYSLGGVIEGITAGIMTWVIFILLVMDEITALPESGLSVLKDMQNDDLMPAKVKMLHGSHLYRNPLEPGNSKPPNLPSLLCRAVGSAEELLPSGDIVSLLQISQFHPGSRHSQFQIHSNRMIFKIQQHNHSVVRKWIGLEPPAQHFFLPIAGFHPGARIQTNLPSAAGLEPEILSAGYRRRRRITRLAH